MLVRTQVTAMEACKVAIMIQSGDCCFEAFEMTTVFQSRDCYRGVQGDYHGEAQEAVHAGGLGSVGR